MHQDQSSIFGAQVTASAIIVWVFRILERRFPHLQTIAPAVKRTVAWILAGAAAVGIHASFNPETHVLVISGLTFSGIAHAGWDWLRSIAVQEWIHRSTK